MELEITWDRVVRVWWSYLWRSLICILIAMLIGMICGFIIGFTLGFIGFPASLIRLVTGSIGFALGLAISILPMKLILGKDYGDFRLVLLAKQDNFQPTTVQPAYTPLGSS